MINEREDGPESTVLALSGSLRRDSCNTRLLCAAGEVAPPALRIEVEPAVRLPLFDEDAEAAAFADGKLPALVQRIARADALLIATPEYNHSFPGALKNTLDWLSRPGAGGVLVGKPVAVIGASSGRWGTRLAQAALRQVLFACEARVITGPALYLGAAAEAFDASGRLLDDGIRDGLREILLALMGALPGRVAR